MEFLVELSTEGDMPEALASMPMLPEHLQPFLDAFFTLSQARPVGMGVGAIPASEIVVVAEIYGLPPFECLFLCRALDGVYLEAMADRQKKEQAKQQRHGNRKTRTRN